jgi:hypothetical protein
VHSSRQLGQQGHRYTLAFAILRMPPVNHRSQSEKRLEVPTRLDGNEQIGCVR